MTRDLPAKDHGGRARVGDYGPTGGLVFGYALVVLARQLGDLLLGRREDDSNRSEGELLLFLQLLSKAEDFGGETLRVRSPRLLRRGLHLG